MKTKTKRKKRARRRKPIEVKPIAKHFVKMRCPHCLKDSITIIATLNDEVIQLPVGSA